MKTQISRFNHRPEQRYAAVFQQMGRMITDSDWNELIAILRERADEALRDVVGSATPRARQLSVVNQAGKPKIQPGNLYAGGLCATFPGDPAVPVGYDEQADFPLAPGAIAANEILYADVWERPVLFLEDARINDDALDGADTCTRSRVVVQVKRCPAGVNPMDPAKNPTIGTVLATVTVAQPIAEGDACDPCAGTVNVNTKTGNFLFRLEVHDVVLDGSGAAQELTLKWSSENGAEACRTWTAPGVNPPAAISPPPGFVQTSYTYEAYGVAADSHLGVHLVTGPSFPARGTLKAGEPPAASAEKPFLRRWDGWCTLKKSGGNWTLHDGYDRATALKTSYGSNQHGYVTVDANGFSANLEVVKVELKIGSSKMVAGDYWLAPVRETNRDDAAKVIVDAPPSGIPHRYVRLGAWTGSVFTPDRPVFASLADLASQTLPGAAWVGADAVARTGTRPGTVELPAGTVDSQLAALLGAFDSHVDVSADAHAASAISTLSPAPDAPALAQNVQAQLTELLKILNAGRNAAKGPAMIQSGRVDSSPPGTRFLDAGSLLDQLKQIVKFLNEPITNADKLDGLDSGEFARAMHRHDELYLRTIHAENHRVNHGDQVSFGVVSPPDSIETVLVSYSVTNGQDVVTSWRWVNGPYTPSLEVLMTKHDSDGDGEAESYEVSVVNHHATADLQVYVSIVGTTTA